MNKQTQKLESDRFKHVQEATIYVIEKITK